jgi:hypothetical protein
VVTGIVAVRVEQPCRPDRDVSAVAWLTYRDAAERLKVTPAMVADTARMKWPSRLQNDNTAEVELPGEVLAEVETGQGARRPRCFWQLTRKSVCF